MIKQIEIANVSAFDIAKNLMLSGLELTLYYFLSGRNIVNAVFIFAAARLIGRIAKDDSFLRVVLIVVMAIVAAIVLPNL